MEGKLSTWRSIGLAGLVLWTLVFPGMGGLFVKDLLGQTAEDEGGQISLQRSVVTRDYNGKSIEGQERVVGQGDSLWRILIQEKGLSEKRFGQYLSLVHRLNPQMKTADVLRLGDKVFIPLRPDEMLGSQTLPPKAEALQAGKGPVRDYTVKQGDFLLRILKEQLGISDEKKLALYYNLARDLNPEKKNWDILQAGETLRLPAVGPLPEGSEQGSKPGAKDKFDAPGANEPGPLAAESKPSSESDAPATPSMGLEYTRQLSARENLALLGEAVETVGNEIQRTGQEVMPIKSGTIQIDTSSFPIVL